MGINDLTKEELADLTATVNERLGEFGNQFSPLTPGFVRLLHGAFDVWQRGRVTVISPSAPLEPSYTPPPAQNYLVAEALPAGAAKAAEVAHTNGHHTTPLEEDRAELDALTMDADTKAAKLRATIYALQDMAVDGKMPTLTEWDRNRPPGQITADGIQKRHQLSWNQLAEYARLKPNGVGRGRKHTD